MLFRRYISKCSMPLMAAICILTLLSCEKEHDELSFTNPIDPDNPETHGDPYNVRVQAKDKSIAVQWDTTLEADGFVVYRSSSPDGGFEKIGTASTNEYQDADAPPGVTYYYQVRAYRGNEKNQTVPSFLTHRTHAAIKSPPSVTITSAYQEWESGTLEIKAQAIDIDGNVQHVQFEYSLNGQTWNEIATDAESPYNAEWDTTSVVESSDDSVWVKITATDDDDLTSEKAVDTSFGIDNEPPWVEEWSRTPDDITEDTSGKLRISVLVSDGDGSGPAKNAPQLDYHIGEETAYRGHKAMTMESKNTWRYDILEPSGGWDRYRGEHVYYRVKLVDAVGNEVVGDEQTEAIDSIDDPSVLLITSRFASWENGILTIDADASDVDSAIASVQFYYSIDRSTWISMAIPDSSAPYSVKWDTTEAIPETANAVWIKAMATDNDGNTAEHILPNSFGVDNQPPIISHDYDGLWNNEDFAIKLQADDKGGSGVSNISYILNKGSERKYEVGDQGSVSVSITTEGADNSLEYWCVDKLGNEGKREILSAIKLDKTKPAFSNWQKSADLNEDSSGSFRVSVRITDSGGSGLGDEVPQLGYHIGSDDQNDSYENMATEDGNAWYYNIPEPSDTWGVHGNKYIYYKAIVQDVAGNSRESLQQTELIDSDNNPPEIISEPVTTATEGYLYTYDVEATDPDADSVLTYSLTTLPEGMEINSSTGVVSWIPTSTQIGSINVTVRVADSVGAYAAQSFTISVDNRTVDDIGEMVLIPAGEFEMGKTSGAGSDDELPVHTVYVDAFYIDIYEVTNAQYQGFMDATGHSAPGYWSDSSFNAPEQPVVGVSWNDAVAYAEWAGKRLPTEAEWEKAARGGLSGKVYPWGDEFSYDDANLSGIDGKDVWSGPSPVGSFAPNGYGLYDMAGNVNEWCTDWYDSGYYANSPDDNPLGPDSGTSRVLRGGSWYNPRLHLRVAHRKSNSPTYTATSVGFRCVEGEIGDENYSPEITSEAVTVATEDELYSYDVDATDQDVGDVLAYSLTTSPSGMSIDSSTGVISWTPTNAHVGNNSVTVEVSDGNGGIDTESFTITVSAVGGSRIEITSSPVTAARAGVLYIYYVDATSSEPGDTLTYSLDTEIPGMGIELSTGLLTWTPTNAQVGSNSVMVVVRNDTDQSDEQPFTIVVSSMNNIPEITSTAVMDATTDELYSYDVEAVDPDAGDVLTYSLTESPSGMNIDEVTGEITWTPADTHVGQHSVTVTVSDGSDEATQSFSVTVVDKNDSPQITSEEVTTATEDELYTYDVDATDPDVGDVLTYTLTTSPSGMSMDSSTGIITWTPTNDDVGDHNVTVKVSDGDDESDIQSFSITVINVNDDPAITSTAITTATAEKLYTYSVKATDPDAGDVLTYSLTTSPTDMSMNSSTGVISWTPVSSHVGENSVIVQVEDNDGSNTQPFTITVADVPRPEITSSPVTTAREDVLYIYYVNAKAPEPGDILTYSLTIAPSGMSIEPSTGLITWLPNNAQLGSNNVTVTVSDGNSSVEQSFTIAVANGIKDP